MTIDLQCLNVELRDLKPPIPRDRLIFEAVIVQRRGQQEVAQEHGISQPRVSIIVAEVTAWLCRVLPQATAKEATEGQLALGVWLAQARLEFLYAKAMETFEESRQKKVVHKQWKRNDVSWEQTTTVNQSAKAGLFSGAMRAAQAINRLFVTAAEKGWIGGQSHGASQPKPVMSKAAKMERQPQVQSPQDQAGQVVMGDDTRTADEREAVIKSIMETARQNPKRADWTEEELRWAAEIALAKTDAAVQEKEAWLRQKRAAKMAKAAAREAKEAAAPAVPPAPVAANSGIEAPALPIPRKHAAESLSLSAARIEKLRREREKRRSPEERRRAFLAPLAAG